MMTAVPLALQALLTLALPGGDQTDWQAEAKKSVVLVTGLNGQPATGFLVGWEKSTLYFVTARHAAYHDSPGQETIVAETVSVTLGPGVCGKTVVATPFRDDVESDTAILIAPMSGCEAAIGQMRSLHPTTLTAFNAPVGAKLVALVRGPDKSIGWPVDLTLKGWTPGLIVMQQKTEEEWSGAPLFTGNGEIAGVLRSSESGAGYASDFVTVMKNPRFEGVPFNLAGLFSEIQLKGYPSGSRLTIKKGNAGSVIELADSPQRLPLPPGSITLGFAAAGYDPVEDDVTIVEGRRDARCVRMVRPFDRGVAKAKWMFVGLTAALGVTGYVYTRLTSDAKDSFYAMPSTAGYDDANHDVNVTRDLFIATGISGALTVAAFWLNHFSPSWTLASEIEACPP